jgi:uncharacterized SAM-binding protein YcdF (DUF218 family)
MQLLVYESWDSKSRMVFFLRKFIEALLLPIGVSGLLTIAGLALRRRWIVFAGFLILGVFSMPFVSRMMVGNLERVYEPKAVSASPEADAIVVLSGGIVRGMSPPGVQWGESANRYFAGLDLAMAGKAKVIIFSSGMLRFQGELLRQSAIRHGLAPERIVLTRSVLTTEDEARAVSEISGIHSILLVTSGFHMPRAALLFRARGLNVAPFPTDERVLSDRELSAGDFIPGSGALQSSEEALREYYGLAVYRAILLLRSSSF